MSDNEQIIIGEVAGSARVCVCVCVCVRVRACVCVHMYIYIYVEVYKYNAYVTIKKGTIEADLLKIVRQTSKNKINNNKSLVKRTKLKRCVREKNLKRTTCTLIF